MNDQEPPQKPTRPGRHLLEPHDRNVGAIPKSKTVRKALNVILLSPPGSPIKIKTRADEVALKYFQLAMNYAAKPGQAAPKISSSEQFRFLTALIEKTDGRDASASSDVAATIEAAKAGAAQVIVIDSSLRPPREDENAERASFIDLNAPPNLMDVFPNVIVVDDPDEGF